ncbi:MAG: SCO family protein, partial [Actinomycetota bacterium]
MKVSHALVLASVLIVVAAACGSDDDDGDGGPLGLAGVELSTPTDRPDFVLTDTAGEPFDFRAETGGELTLMYFGYTECPDICPVHLA